MIICNEGDGYPKMDDGSRLPWIIAVLLLFCAAFFAVAETAYASCPKSRVKAAAERGDARAKTALLILDDFDKAISTLLICTSIEDSINGHLSCFAADESLLKKQIVKL